MCSHGHSACIMSLIHWMAYKGNLLPFSFLSRSQLPWQASESRVVLYSKVLTSRLGFWFKKKKKPGSSVPYFCREHMVCTCFVIGFYPLAGRCHCILSECSLHHCTDPHCFSFAWVIDRGGVVTRLPRKYSFSSVYFCVFIWNSIFSSLGMLPSNKQHDELLILYFWLPILAFPAPSAPNLWLCWMPSVMLRLAAGQLKDKQLLNKSMTLFRTNRAVERV